MTDDHTKYRLITRSDMDGLVCAVLLKEMGILGEIVFHHPKDVQDGKVAVTERDILTTAKSEWLVRLLYSFQDDQSIYLAMVSTSRSA